MTKLITNYDKEWLAWAEFFIRLWPELMLDELADMADRMIDTFSEHGYFYDDNGSFIGW